MKSTGWWHLPKSQSKRQQFETFCQTGLRYSSHSTISEIIKCSCKHKCLLNITSMFVPPLTVHMVKGSESPFAHFTIQFPSASYQRQLTAGESVSLNPSVASEVICSRRYWREKQLQVRFYQRNKYFKSKLSFYDSFPMVPYV